MSEIDKLSGVSTLTGYRDRWKIQHEEIARLKAGMASLEDQNWALTLALLDRPVPADAPGPTFPDEPIPHTDPTPAHPDYVETHLIVAATNLDAWLAA